MNRRRRLTPSTVSERALTAELDQQTLVQDVTDAATEIVGAQLGACYFTVTGKARRSGEPSQDGGSERLYAISGTLDDASTVFPLTWSANVLADPLFKRTGVVRSDDITADHRYRRSRRSTVRPMGSHGW